jgi:putative copper export protein
MKSDNSRLDPFAFGNLLLLKWGVLLPMLLLGFINRYAVLPGLYRQKGIDVGSGIKGQIARRLQSMAPGVPPDLQKTFFPLITIEAVLGIGILLLTAILTQLPPR